MGSGRSLTFGGRPWVVLPPGAQVYSDPLPCEVAAQADLAVSLYLEADSGLTTAHPIGLRTAWLAPGNQVSATRLGEATPFSSYLWLAGIDVRAAANDATIVAFGDSITDGFSTTPDADLAWPSILARRLATQKNQPPRAVINMGISGNRVLREGAGSSALARFDRDVLSRPGTRWVLLLEGINDIGFLAFVGNDSAEQLNAEGIITGYRMPIERARLHGLDAVTRDPAARTRLRAEYDSGDHIHPNDAGNKAMADTIDLKLFR